MTSQQLITSIKLSFKQRVGITIFTGSMIGLITLIVLFILDPINWKIVPESNFLINGMVLWAFGMLIANMYYRYQLKKHESITLFFEEESITVSSNNETVHYHLEALVQLKLDQQLYFLFGLKRLTFGFKSENPSKLIKYPLLLNAQEAHTLYQRIRNIKSKQSLL